MQLFALLTDVEAIYRDFGTPRARRLARATADELRRYAAAGHFPAGSMAVKVEALLRFVEAGGARALVTSPERLAEALAAEAGTHVIGS